MTPEEALEKKAENARELGLDYEPAQQEPVAWMVYAMDGLSVYVTDNFTDISEGQRALPLYTSPPAQRTWVGLTQEEVGNLSDFAYANDEEFVRNVEKHLKEKNT